MMTSKENYTRKLVLLRDHLEMDTFHTGRIQVEKRAKILFYI